MRLMQWQGDPPPLMQQDPDWFTHWSARLEQARLDHPVTLLEIMDGTHADLAAAEIVLGRHMLDALSFYRANRKRKRRYV
jgi:hypothetical protein